MPGDCERDTVTILKSGDAFPVIEVLHQVLSLVNVTAITTVELISIKHSHLFEILMKNPNLGKDYKNILSQHFRENEVRLLRKRGRLPEMIPAEHSLGQGDMFTYEIRDDGEYNAEEIAYLGPFKKLGKLDRVMAPTLFVFYDMFLGKLEFIRYFLLKKSIDPHCRYFFFWEISRCIFAFTRVFLAYTYFNLLLDYRPVLAYIQRFLDFTSTLDLYIRCHCQYYNEEGILVTHPWSTARHYFKTSFALDFFAMMPFREIQLDQIFGYHYREQLYVVLVLLSRPCQLHRLFSLINYIHSKVQTTSTILYTLKFTLVVFMLLNTIAIILQMLTCEIISDDENNPLLLCVENSWIDPPYLQGQLTPKMIYIRCLYAAFVLFTTATCGAVTLNTVNALTVFLFIVIPTYMIRLYLYAKIISYQVRPIS